MNDYFYNTFSKHLAQLELKKTNSILRDSIMQDKMVALFGGEE